jgi:hypothetical protein
MVVVGRNELGSSASGLLSLQAFLVLGKSATVELEATWRLCLVQIAKTGLGHWL